MLLRARGASRPRDNVAEVIRAVIAAVVVVAGCGYGAPDYDGTRFLCGDLDRCPPGQSCIGGECREETPGDGVFCDGDICAPGEQCCVEAIIGAYCLSGGEFCPGQAAFCDGVEDCGEDEYCCDGGDATCCTDDFFLVCQDEGDCTAIEPLCCFDSGMPWGNCASECF